MKKLLGGLVFAALLFSGVAQANDGPGIRFLRHPWAFLYGNRIVYSEIVPIGPFNDAWLRPFAGYTVYPGEPGSGFDTHSDYSHINYVVSPENNAAMVRAKLQSMGIPPVRPEPIFLGKNPHVTDNVKLPVPRKVEKKAGENKDNPR